MKGLKGRKLRGRRRKLEQYPLSKKSDPDKTFVRCVAPMTSENLLLLQGGNGLKGWAVLRWWNLK